MPVTDPTVMNVIIDKLLVPFEADNTFSADLLISPTGAGFALFCLSAQIDDIDDLMVLKSTL